MITAILLCGASLQAGVTNKNVTEALFQKIGSIDERTTRMLPTINTLQANVASLLAIEKATPKSFVSTFGEAIVSSVQNQIAVQFRYGIPPDAIIDIITTGTVEVIDGICRLETGAGGGEVSLRSKRRVPYQAGHESFTMFTGSFTLGGIETSFQLLGLYDSSNGVAIGFDGPRFSIMIRRNGTSTFVGQSEFNRDTLDGNGSSGFVIDPTKINVFRIAFGWLGSAPIKYQVMKEDGTWIVFHMIEQPNSATTTSFQYPTLPFTAKAKCFTTNLLIKTSCWDAGIVGSQGSTAARLFTVDTAQTVGVTTETHILTIRSKTTYRGLDNFIEAVLLTMGGGATDFNNSINILRLRTNATVTGLSYSDVNTTNSIMELSTAGTYTAGSGTSIFLLGSNTFGSGPQNVFFPPHFPLRLAPGDTITLTIQSIGTAAASANGHLSWQELF